MRRSRSGRWLAPLALVIVAIAVYAIVQSGSSNGGSDGSGSGPGPGTTSTTSTSGRRKGTTPPKQAKPAAPATYTVQQGDTLVGIAAKTGVPLDRLEALNPGLDASAMHIGQRIRLRP